MCQGVCCKLERVCYLSFCPEHQKKNVFENMPEVTLSLAILLGAGFIAAKLGQLMRLPSVTGYICAGLLLGPAGLNLITEEATGEKLEHFTQIALMLIAFGIGEHLELKRIKPVAKSVMLIGLGETSGAFLLVGLGSFFVAWLTGVGEIGWQVKDFLTLAMLLGAVSVATAPAATLHVMRELKASGPLTSTLLAVVAVDDGLAIMFFGITVSLVHQVVGSEAGTILGAIAGGLFEILASLIMGLMTGFLIDYIVHRLKRREEMLTVGLALLLFCGEVARLNHLSPLLAGMAAGFAVVNRDRRDVRVFRAMNAFEPPIYVLFFTLAGAHLNLTALAGAGWVGLTYFLLRGLGKMTGANLGARFAGAKKTVQNYLGFALVPQAGVAIGLIFLIQGDTSLTIYSSVIIPVVLAGVVLSEILGPVSARFAVTRARESKAGRAGENGLPPQKKAGGAGRAVAADDNIRLLPWTWEKLKPPAETTGSVIFGIAHPATVAGLARIAVLLANHCQARPMAVRVILDENAGKQNSGDSTETGELFSLSEAEAQQIGLELSTETIRSKSVASGLIEAAGRHGAKAILLGHPVEGTAQEFQRVVEAVAKEAPCEVIVVRLAGVLHSERILVPVTNETELSTVRNVVRALADIGDHRLVLLRLMPPDSTDEELFTCRNDLLSWTEKESIAPSIECRIASSEARLDTILKEAAQQDLIIMAATGTKGLSRLFFGSLAEDVAQHSDKPMLIVHGPKGKNGFEKKGPEKPLSTVNGT